MVKVKRESNTYQNPTDLEKYHNGKRKLYFFINFIIEIVLLNLVYFYCVKNRLEKLGMFFLTIVVRIHFIPMAFFMKIKQYFVCSFLMIAIGILFIVINNAMNNSILVLLQSFLNAIALWLTVALSIKEVNKNNSNLK